MKEFCAQLLDDIKKISWQQNAILVFSIFVIYGLVLVNPTTFYDFNSAKGDALHVFLTYFFMHRIGVACIAGIFHDFAPMWKFAFGLAGLFLAGQLLIVLFRRQSVGVRLSVLMALLWLSMPVFFCITMYQHGMPVQSLAICADVVALLAFEQMRREECNGSLNRVVILMSCFALSCYEANASLLLTGMLGVCMISSAQSWKAWLMDLWRIFWLIGVALIFWALLNYGPMILANVLGVVIPKSGGAHTTIVWLTGEHTFLENLKSLFVGLLLNWGYNAFFVVGLRCVILSLVTCSIVGIVAVLRGKVLCAAGVGAFAFSVFVFPIIQCASANLRTYYCLIPLVVFSAILALRQCANRYKLYRIVLGVIAFCAFELGYETSSLYYYCWKVKQHDTMHMTIIAHDLWKKYGLKIDKPVAIVGGWDQYPTSWEDMRPFRFLPMINHPFPLFSNVSGFNVPREFYMVAREKVGLVMPMADCELKSRLLHDEGIYKRMPSYPQRGYIAERDGVVVVNLGKFDSQWRRFRLKDYMSPNEKLLDEKLGVWRAEAFITKITRCFRDLAIRYPWTVECEH